MKLRDLDFSVQKINLIKADFTQGL